MTAAAGTITGTTGGPEPHAPQAAQTGPPQLTCIGAECWDAAWPQAASTSTHLARQALTAGAATGTASAALDLLWATLQMTRP